MEERRRYGRKEPQFRVVCWTSRVPMRRIDAESLNISFGGIRLRVSEDLKTNEIVHLRILKRFWQKPMEAMGRIVWQNESDVAGKIIAGIRFISAPWSQIEELLYR